MESLWAVLWAVPAYAIWAIAVYFTALYVLSRIALRAPRPAGAFDGIFVLIVPAHNEGAVIIDTIRSAKKLEGARFHMMILDDGSSDETRAAARFAIGDDERFSLVVRSAQIAGAGKGAVLNHGFRLVGAMAEAGDTRLQGLADDKIIIGIVDGDGHLDRRALAEVGPYFDAADVGAVQIPVTISNARARLLARLQDIDFVGFSMAVQTARDRLGSVGHGGNGHFTRYSTLRAMGGDPWSRSLTEDLDLGLRMTEAGWTTRFCPHTFVAQQGLEDFGAMVRQRTRWLQGHYSSWRHLRPLWRRDAPIPLRTRIDYSLYLTMVVAILVMAAFAVCGFLALLGVFEIPTGMTQITSELAIYAAFVVIVSFLPVGLFIAAYQQHARFPLRWWAIVPMVLAFTTYHYGWGVPASARALTRMALGHNEWTKTARVEAQGVRHLVSGAKSTVAATPAELHESQERRRQVAPISRSRPAFRPPDPVHPRRYRSRDPDIDLRSAESEAAATESIPEEWQ